MKISFLASAFAMAIATVPSQALEIGPPIDCTLGRDCWVQNFVDVAPGGEARDHGCGSRTYDGHKGTDFRIADLAAMERGVAVIAVADGTVLRVRDGMADRILANSDDPAIRNRECGNGVVIDHGAGWTTQYCHMKRNSVRVRSGDRVRRGAAIGAVGLSGKTEFPHVHVTLRRNDRVIDPMTGEAAVAGCRQSGNALFEPVYARQIADQATSLLNNGFATGPVRMNDIEKGIAEVAAIDRNAPALVFYARVIWLRKGDRAAIELFGPSGDRLVTAAPEPADRDKAQWMSFAGKKRPTAGWTPGRYRARYRVIRGGKAVLEVNRSIEMR